MNMPQTIRQAIGGWLELCVSLKPVRIMLHQADTSNDERDPDYFYTVISDNDLQLDTMLDAPALNETAVDDDYAHGSLLYASQ